MRFLLPVCALCLLGCGAAAARPAPTVLFVVLDTVRADRLSLCGYSRPTSPTLERLRERGAAWTCRAYAPGDWTLPSHASFFTGAPVLEHGAHGIKATGIARPRFNPTRGLGEELPTLAEHFASEGYQTALVAGNPLLAQLARGYHHRVAEERLSGEALLAALDRLLATGLDRSRGPLFLTVNLMDAHDPWPPIPEDFEWAPPREGLGYAFHKGCRDNVTWRRFLRGTMPDDEREALRERVSDLYDHGIWLADRALGGLLDRLERAGWFAQGLRLVVTSDHGEFLGEHGLLAHGLHLYEENQRVPLVYFEQGRSLEFPEPISALASFSLLRDGRLPAPLPAVQAVSFPAPVQAHCSKGRMGEDLWVAEWRGMEKRTWVGGERFWFDLSDDPREQRPRRPRAGEAWRRIDTLAEGALQAFDAKLEMDPGMLEALRAIGYAE